MNSPDPDIPNLPPWVFMAIVVALAALFFLLCVVGGPTAMFGGAAR